MPEQDTVFETNPSSPIGTRLDDIAPEANAGDILVKRTDWAAESRADELIFIAEANPITM